MAMPLISVFSFKELAQLLAFEPAAGAGQGL